jgi:hypothetical protein
MAATLGLQRLLGQLMEDFIRNGILHINAAEGIRRTTSTLEAPVMRQAFLGAVSVLDLPRR